MQTTLALRIIDALLPAPPSHLHDVPTVPFGVVDLKGDKILALDARALPVIDSHTLSLKAQLEELALRYGHFHLGCLAGHLRVDDVMGIWGNGGGGGISLSAGVSSCCRGGLGHPRPCFFRGRKQSLLRGCEHF